MDAFDIIIIAVLWWLWSNVCFALGCVWTGLHKLDYPRRCE